MDAWAEVWDAPHCPKRLANPLSMRSKMALFCIFMQMTKITWIKVVFYRATKACLSLSFYKPEMPFHRLPTITRAFPYYFKFYPNYCSILVNWLSCMYLANSISVFAKCPSFLSLDITSLRLLYTISLSLVLAPTTAFK